MFIKKTDWIKTRNELENLKEKVEKLEARTEELNDILQFAKDERASDLMGSIHYIQTCPAKTSTLGYVMSVDEFDMERIPQEALAEHCMREMTYKLAEALVPYIKIETERDILTRRQIIRGSVRVINPDFRF